jgi:hypothetical protein
MKYLLTITQNLLGSCGGDYWNIETIEEEPIFASFAFSMYSLVFNGEPIGVSVVSLVAECGLFQTKPALLGRPYRVESGVSSDSLRVLVNAVSCAVAEISDVKSETCHNIATNSSSRNLPRRSEVGRRNTR